MHSIASFKLLLGCGLAFVLAFAAGASLAQETTPRKLNNFVVVPGQGVLTGKVYVPGVVIHRRDEVDICSACPNCCKTHSLSYTEFRLKYQASGHQSAAVESIVQTPAGVVLKDQNFLIPKATYVPGQAKSIKSWEGRVEIKDFDFKATESK